MRGVKVCGCVGEGAVAGDKHNEAGEMAQEADNSSEAEMRRET